MSVKVQWPGVSPVLSEQGHSLSGPAAILNRLLSDAEHPGSAPRNPSDAHQMGPQFLVAARHIAFRGRFFTRMFPTARVSGVKAAFSPFFWSDRTGTPDTRAGVLAKPCTSAEEAALQVAAAGALSGCQTPPALSPFIQSRRSCRARLSILDVKDRRPEARVSREGPGQVQHGSARVTGRRARGMRT